MKRIFAVAVAALLLAGCASSMEERRGRGAIDSYISSKSVDDVSRCVLFSWQSYTWYGGPINVMVQPNQFGGSTVSAIDTSFFADLIPKGSQTKVNYYGGGAIGKELRPLVKSCI